MKNFLTLLLISSVLIFQSCENRKKEPKTEKQISAKKIEESSVNANRFKSDLRPNENLELGKTYTDTVNYISANDESDEAIFTVKKDKDTISLIYYKDEIKPVRGDEIEIKWKMDSIRYAGDPEYLQYSEFLISSKKIKPLKLVDKKIKFLWRETSYNEALKTDINSIILNEKYIKTISEPEKAALAYIATFVGNECGWDGNANENRSNLKCKILWALGLGYQCSTQHLELIKYWFRSNKDILKEVGNCPTTPDGATIQDTFDEIFLETKNNEIIISFKASGFNMREEKSWNWTEKHFLKFKENELILTKKEVSKINRGTFEVSGN
ncbi:MAG: hypothetical protein ABIP95_04760 [Pelobium sp.]